MYYFEDRSENGYRNRVPLVANGDPSADSLKQQIKNLKVAVLQKALRDHLLKPEDKDSAFYKQDAGEWIFSDVTEPYSFLDICSDLEYDPARLRKQIRENPDKVRAAISYKKNGSHRVRNPRDNTEAAEAAASAF